MNTLMKIDAACIDHNALRLIEEVAESYWTLCDTEDLTEIKIALAEIGAISRLARALKEAEEV